VNIKKSEVVVFNAVHSKQNSNCHVNYDKIPLSIAQSFVYLGLCFDSTHNVEKSGHRSLTKGRAAMFAMSRRCHELDLHNVFIKCRLFDALVKPILTYGSEIRGPGTLCRGHSLTDSGFSKDLENLHKGFLRQSLGLRKSTSDFVLMTELRRHPLVFDILAKSLRFWNKIMARCDDDLVKISMCENVHLSLAHSKSDMWSSQLNLILSRVGSDTLFSERGDPNQRLDVEGILDCAKSLWSMDIAKSLPSDGECLLQQAVVGSAIRSRGDDERQGFKLLKYKMWFLDESCELRNTFWFNLNRYEQISDIARFRMGSHWLNVEMGRFNGIPRSKRLCSCCDRSEVEDEMHLLICPMYDHIRNNLDVSFKQLLCLQPHGRELDMHMCSYMNFSPLHDETLSAYSFWHKLASYLTQSKYCHNDVLS
jgi:hypothetical protein